MNDPDKSEAATAPTVTASESHDRAYHDEAEESADTVTKILTESKGDEAPEPAAAGDDDGEADEVTASRGSNPITATSGEPARAHPSDDTRQSLRKKRGRPPGSKNGASKKKSATKKSGPQGTKQRPLETGIAPTLIKTGLPVSVDTTTLILRPPFSDLLPIDARTREFIKSSMQLNGFDDSQPVHAYKDGDQLVVTDGCTRTTLARELEIATIPVFIHEFADENAALEFAMDCQVKRRNLTDGDLARFVELYDEKITPGSAQPRAAGGTFQPKASSDAPGKSATRTAAKLGVSPTKIERARRVNKKADAATKKAVLANEMTINAALKQIKKAGKTTPAKHISELASETHGAGATAKSALFPFNPIDGSDVAFASWDPLEYKQPEIPDDPQEAAGIGDATMTLDETKLALEFDAKVSRDLPNTRVLVSPTHDLFADDVPAKIVRKVLLTAAGAKQFQFLFTTSNPDRLQEFSWEANTFAGVSIYEQRDVAAAEAALLAMDGLSKWLVVEQLTMELTFEHLDQLDWLVVRQGSGLPGAAPDTNAVKSLLRQAWAVNCPVLFERGVTYRPADAPKAVAEVTNAEVTGHD